MAITFTVSVRPKSPEDIPPDAYLQDEGGKWLEVEEGERRLRLWKYTVKDDLRPAPMCYEPGCWAGLGAPCQESDLSLFKEIIESREPGMVWWPSLWPILWPSSEGDVFCLAVHEAWGEALLDLYGQRRGWGEGEAGFIQRWPYTQRTGTSSAAIYTCLTHRTPPSANKDFDPTTIPLDLDALRRCVELVQGAGWTGRMGEMRRVGAGWAEVVERWGRWMEVLDRADPLELEALDAEIHAVYFKHRPWERRGSVVHHMDATGAGMFSGPAFEEGGHLEGVDLGRLNAGDWSAMYGSDGDLSAPHDGEGGEG